MTPDPSGVLLFYATLQAMQKYVVLNKQVGETPLVCAEEWRAAHPEFEGLPLAYAGRLDPMASGKLLILIGDECKRQSEYHGLDKTYEFEVLFGVQSDSGDVLGLVTECDVPRETDKATLQNVATNFVGDVTFPYPKFSSKTIEGKPLHTWTLEGRLDEVDIPTYTSTVYRLQLLQTYTLSRAELYEQASAKIETIPPVTDERKAIGNDFRRPEVRSTWKTFKSGTNEQNFTIARFSCTCSSGTYMRTLAEEIAKKIGTCGLAYSIHRTQIGKYKPLPLGFGVWLQKF